MNPPITTVQSAESQKRDMKLSTLMELENIGFVGPVTMRGKMAEELLLTVLRAPTFNVPYLGPSDIHSRDVLAGMKIGETVRVVIDRPRNVKHHRKFFVLLDIVYNEQSLYSTKENLLDALKIATGHFSIFIMPSGEKVVRPHSIAFHAMDQISFEEFYERAVDIIIAKILPAVNREDLEQRVYNALGEPGPYDIKAKTSKHLT